MTSSETTSVLSVASFPPIEGPEARLLILGTMPGRASLLAHEYYAHPRNGFWDIVGAMVGFDRTEPYPKRVAALIAARFAVWDVLKSCVRVGSLDSAIDETTLVPNDFAEFFASHPHIGRVCFNGAKAEALFHRHVAPRLPVHPDRHFVRLPSTSPANASISLADKMRTWRTVLAQNR